MNQFECKKTNADEIVYNTEHIGNILLFVSIGKIRISNKNATPIMEVNEGHFVLFPAEKCHIITAITPTETTMMHAGTLSEMITEDPEWNPDLPVVLPIFPALAQTLALVNSYEKERLSFLN